MVFFVAFRLSPPPPSLSLSFCTFLLSLTGIHETPSYIDELQTTPKKLRKQEDILGSVRRSLFQSSSKGDTAAASGAGDDDSSSSSFSGAPYCVLVLDEVTTPVVSGATSVSEVLDYGVARE